MFENLKKLKELKELQNSLEKEKIEIDKSGIKISINGKMEIEKIELNQALNKEEQEVILKENLNEGLKKIQMLIAQKMMQLQN